MVKSTKWYFGLRFLVPIVLTTLPAANANAEVSASVAASITIDNSAAGASPSMTFTFQLTKARSGNLNDIFFRMTASSDRPSNFPAWTDQTCPNLLPKLTITVNSVAQNISNFISDDPNFCGFFSTAMMLKLKAGVSLQVNDVISVTFASGIFNNPASLQTGTWSWNTAISTGGDADIFSASLTAGAAEYDVAISGNPNGAATASPATVISGGSATLEAVADDGYRFASWDCIGGGTLDSPTANPALLSNITADSTCTPIFEAIGPPGPNGTSFDFDLERPTISGLPNTR